MIKRIRMWYTKIMLIFWQGATDTVSSYMDRVTGPRRNGAYRVYRFAKHRWKVWSIRCCNLIFSD